MQVCPSPSPSPSPIKDNLDWKLLADQYSPTFNKCRSKFDGTGEGNSGSLNSAPVFPVLAELALTIASNDNEWIGEVAKLKAQHQTYVDEAEKLKQNYAQLQTDREKLDAIITNLEIQKKHVEESLAASQGVEEEHNKLTLEHELLNGTCENLKKQITKIEAKKTTIKTELAASTQRVAQLENRVQEIQQEVDLEKAKAEALEKQVVEMQEQQVEAQANLQTLNENVEVLQTTLDEEIEKVKQLELDKDDLQLRADGFESKADVLEKKLEKKKLGLQLAKDAVEAKDAEINQIGTTLEIKKIEAANSAFLPNLDCKVWKHLISNNLEIFFSSPIRKLISLIAGLVQYLIFRFHTRSSLEKELNEAAANSPTFTSFEVKMDEKEKLVFSKFY